MSYKVVLLGEGRVGKTSLVSRFVKDQFSDAEASTVQANMYSKKKVLVGEQTVELSIWDTAGQERFHALGPIYYRNARGAILVYDITDADTFSKVKLWIRELRQIVGEDIQIVICGNKCDLEQDRAVPVEMAEQFSASQRAVHLSTSAKTNSNVADAFIAIGGAILNSEKGSVRGHGIGAVAGRASSPKKRRGVQIDTGASSESGPSAASTTAAPSNQPLMFTAAGQNFEIVDPPPDEEQFAVRAKSKSVKLGVEFASHNAPLGSHEGSTAARNGQQQQQTSSGEPKKKKKCCSDG